MANSLAKIGEDGGRGERLERALACGSGAGFGQENWAAEQATGLILGKFLPPHLGHQYLFDFARAFVSELNILVCSIRTEPIGGELRWRWVREMAPWAKVLWHSDENPQEPKDHPDFWKIWHDSIRRLVPQGPDYVFASEAYGWMLADMLGAKFIPVDLGRAQVPISGSAVRRDPLGHWSFLPRSVQSYFLKRVCVFGPESTGKSTLTRKLATHYRTSFVAEYARGLLELKGGQCEESDIPVIARGQMASEDALAFQANRLLFCDTDLITTTIWSNILFGRCPQWICREADCRNYDLYLVMDVDSPWTPDSQRYFPDREHRIQFLARCVRELEVRKRPFLLLSGSWDRKFRKACEAIDALMAGRRL